MAGRPKPPLSDKEKKRIADAIGSGIYIRDLHASGRFQGVSMDTMAAIADEHGVGRKQHPNKGKARSNGNGTRP